MFEEITAFRHEHKYIEPEINLISAQKRLQQIMKIDEHASEKGFYNVRSLYFDDYHDRYISENCDGVDERMKWRIRVYDRDSSFISLERKIRKSDLISKQSCTINRDVLDRIIRKDINVSESYAPLLNDFIKEMRIHMLHPVVIVEYERIPYVCMEGNTRITFDRNIRSSPELDSLLSDNEIQSRPVLLSGHNLMEVKYSGFLPDHIAHLVEHGRMRRETFSKYYLARKFSYNGGF